MVVFLDLAILHVLCFVLMGFHICAFAGSFTVPGYGVPWLKESICGSMMVAFINATSSATSFF